MTKSEVGASNRAGFGLFYFGHEIERLAGSREALGEQHEYQVQGLRLSSTKVGSRERTMSLLS